MTVYQILKCEKIVSCVPYGVKANAIQWTLENDETNRIPATTLKAHKDAVIYADIYQI